MSLPLVLAFGAPTDAHFTFGELIAINFLLFIAGDFVSESAFSFSCCTKV